MADADRKRHRLLSELSRALRASGRESAEIGRRLGWSGDRLDRILEGEVALEAHVLLKILEELGVPSPEFFARLEPAEADESGDGELDLDRELTGGVTFRELRDLVRETVRQATAAAREDDEP